MRRQGRPFSLSTGRSSEPWFCWRSKLPADLSTAFSRSFSFFFYSFIFFLCACFLNLVLPSSCPCKTPFLVASKLIVHATHTAEQYGEKQFTF